MCGERERGREGGRDGGREGWGERGGGRPVRLGRREDDILAGARSHAILQ